MSTITVLFTIILSFGSIGYSTLLNWNTAAFPDRYDSNSEMVYPICGYDATHHKMYILQQQLEQLSLHSFNVINKSFTRHFPSNLVHDNRTKVYGIKDPYSQCYTTINNTIYFANGKKNVGAFNMDTLEIVPSALKQSLYGDKSCFASSSDGRYLFILGGSTMQNTAYINKNLTNTFQIYDFHDQKWYNGPNMRAIRGQFSCNVFNGYLYAIGGSPYGSEATDSIEKIDLSDIAGIINMKKSWRELGVTLTKPLRWHSSVVYANDSIYVMAGTDGGENTNFVNRIEFDGETDRVYLEKAMPYPAAASCSIAADDYGIFVMGGNTYFQKTYKYAEIMEDFYVENPLFVHDSNVTAIRFNESTPALPEANMYMACGYYQDNVYLLGGQTASHQILQYDLVEEEYNTIDPVMNNNTTQPAISCVGQCYASYDDILYYLSGHDIYAFNMSSHELLLLSQDFDIISVGAYACLTVSEDGKYLFILGGFLANETDAESEQAALRNFQIYDIMNNEIHDGPHMLYYRSELTCNVNNGYLFAIGGMTHSSGLKGENYLGSSMPEQIDVSDPLSISSLNQSSWGFISPIESTTVRLRSIVFNKKVMTFGGVEHMHHYIHGESVEYSQKHINIVDPATNNLVFYSDNLVLPVGLFGHCVVNIENDRFYIFGGKVVEEDEQGTHNKIANSVYVGSEIPSNPDNNPAPAINYLIYIIGGGIVILLLTCTMFVCCSKNKKSGVDDKDIIDIKHAMVIGISIRDYDVVDDDIEDEDEEKEDTLDSTSITMDLDDLNGIEIDIQNIRKFTKFLNYKMCSLPSTKPYEWTGREIVDYLQDKAEEFEDNIDEYDGLIVFISCHGVKGHIIASDKDRIEFELIHRIFTNTHVKTREIPRIFIYDCCRGNLEPEYTQNLSIAKGRNSLRIHTPPRIWKVSDLPDNEQIWKAKEHHCDYKKVEIHATSSEFVSKMDSVHGSYFIAEFVNRIMTNNSKYLGEICDDIQTKFHDKKYQLTEYKYNNGTRYIRFGKRKGQNINDMNDVSNDKTALGNDAYGYKEQLL